MKCGLVGVMGLCSKGVVDGRGDEEVQEKSLTRWEDMGWI